MSAGPLRHSAFIPQTFRAFTVIELLFAMAVLAMILVMMVQVVNGILQSTRTQSQQMDSVATARRALDTMLTDIQSAVIGESSTILAPSTSSSNLFAMLTTRHGMSGAADHRFLAVTYSLNPSNQIVRSHGSVNFAQTRAAPQIHRPPTSSATFFSNRTISVSSQMGCLIRRTLPGVTVTYQSS